MKHLDEYRDGPKVKALAAEIHRQASSPLRFMEVCGTHTHAIAKWGLRQLLPETIELISGPGCPVCVTANTDLDLAIAAARLPGVTIATFGDMVRVPGSHSTLAQERARGSDVRVVYSPLDALELAGGAPNRPLIFLGVGFETTAPTVAATVLLAREKGIDNFFVLSLHKTVPLALEVLLELGEVRLDGFLLPGHVSVVLGSAPYEFIPERYGLGCVVAGFEPVDILQATLMLVRQTREKKPQVEIQYRRGVTKAGNEAARRIMAEVFAPAEADWRGLGRLPGTGLVFRPDWKNFDAVSAFNLTVPPGRETPGCRCGEVLRGVLRPRGCPLFGSVCNPAAPVGPCMVSSEGSCAAAWREGR
ncbi:MAG: hydrogenase formation protein HypD [Smithellaceae bacterium]|nr:hydrogenase formation protein HypD [Smithellaceae bacterium]